MVFRYLKHLFFATVAVLCLSDFFNTSAGAQRTVPEKETQQETVKEEGAKFDANEVILGHIMDAHEFHFFSIGSFHVSLPLPVILYSPQRGLAVFSSAQFHHGHAAYNGYRIENEKIVAVKEDGITPDASVKVYDFSLTKNVVQMMLALALLVWLLVNVANKYRQMGGNKAPTGFQNAIEPVITFLRDEVAKPNLGYHYQRYMPFLLTIFFFILINSLFGLIPGSANVTGNIAFTMVLAVISFIVILFSTNRHFWGHIFNPNVPFLVKFILVPVEFLGIFTKPFALMVRLFANMVAGHIIIICFVSLIFIFGSMNKAVGVGFSPVSIAFTVFIYLIEILVAFIQAFIFTNLTAVFIGQAFEGGTHDVDGHDDGVIA